MATFITCDSSAMSLETLLKALAVVHDDGRKGFRMVIVAITECDDLANAFDCDTNAKTLEQHLRESVVLDGCGKPAILMFDTAAAT